MSTKAVWKRLNVQTLLKIEYRKKDHSHFFRVVLTFCYFKYLDVCFALIRAELTFTIFFPSNMSVDWKP